MDSRHDAGTRQARPKSGDPQLAQKTISDGTKLPIVVDPPKNHYGRYKLTSLIGIEQCR
jgi:hypothetical protein